MKKSLFLMISSFMFFFCSFNISAAETPIQLDIPVKSVTSLPIYSEESSTHWFIQDIGAPAFWEKLDSMPVSKEIIVAVIDTGVDYTHPDIAGSIWTNSAELEGLPDVDDDGNGYIDDIYGINTYNSSCDVLDNSVGGIHGHGTHIAGTILQVCNVSGSDNPYHVKIMALKAGNQYGTFHQADIIKAVDYAISKGADVINLSLGTAEPNTEFEQCMKEASKKAVIVAAAGNQGVAAYEETSGSISYYPAAYPYVIGVMAHNSNHYMPSFSNYDLVPDSSQEYELSAPGVDIYSTIPNHKYALMTGTSMASAVISGSVALLSQCYPDKNATEIRELLLACRTYNIQKGDNVPTMMVYGSLDFSAFTPSPTVTPTPQPTKPEPTYTVTSETPKQPTPVAITPIATTTPKPISLKPPVLSSIQVKKNSFILHWEKTSNTAKYEIYRKKGSSGTYKKYATLSASVTKFSDKKLTKGVYYYYKIRCVDTSCKQYSSFSSPRKMILLKKPSSLKLTTKNGSTYLRWAGCTGADGYQIYYQADSKKSPIKLAVKSKNQRSYKVPKRYLHKKGVLKVRAYKKASGSTIYSSYSSKKL